MRNIHQCAAAALLACLAVFFLGGAGAAQENNVKFLEKNLIKQLNHGIYEVVTPKLESGKIEYDRPLPLDKLDFKERNEKYDSIGTAFFISGKELMTAGHIFSPMYFSLQKDYFIRDSEGKVYPVGNIRRYSTVRDMLVFDLKAYPEQIRPLTFNRQVEVGDTVFSAGNALGEGLAYRAGQVASFTDESEYGLWKDIRFSSPASPGNSGGPLLNIKGEVAGVIVKRANSGENYNIAVPISEFDRLTDEAEFQLRNLTMEIKATDESVVRDWSFSLPLPAPVAEVAEKAQASLNEFYRKLGADLNAQAKAKNFPLSGRFRAYLRNQPTFQGFSFLLPDRGFNTWTSIGYSGMEKIPLSEEQSVFRGESLHFNLHVFVEKPPQTPLNAFMESPKMILDAILKAVPYYRPFGGDKVRITSFGEPQEKNAWQDRLGRKWAAALWHGDHDNYFLHMHCLPHPKGAICNLDAKPAGILKTGYLDSVKEGCDEISVGYEGEVDDWAEYLALGEKYLPDFFHKAAISRSGGRLKVRLKDFQFDFSSPKIDGKSALHLHLGYANELLLAEDLVRLELFPQKGSPAHYRIQPFFEPSPFGADSHEAAWKDGMKAKGEFSGKAYSKGELRVVQRTAPQSRKAVTAFDGGKIGKMFVVGCAYTAEEEKKIEQDCGQFFQGIKFF